MATYGAYNIGGSVAGYQSLNTAGWVTQFTCPAGSYAEVLVAMAWTTGGGNALARIYDTTTGYSYQLPIQANSSTTTASLSVKLGPSQAIQFYTSGIVAVCSTFGVYFSNA